MIVALGWNRCLKLNWLGNRCDHQYNIWRECVSDLRHYHGILYLHSLASYVRHAWSLRGSFLRSLFWVVSLGEYSFSNRVKCFSTRVYFSLWCTPEVRRIALVCGYASRGPLDRIGWWLRPLNKKEYGFWALRLPIRRFSQRIYCNNRRCSPGQTGTHSSSVASDIYSTRVYV